jgi:hypothetical protein
MFFLLLASFCESGFSQPLNYEQIFGEEWQKANSFLEINNNWIRPILKKHQISYSLAIAVIFPELVRYSALRDKMEITLLKTLYTNLGDDYANFSIGQFQMKPSFAELVRDNAPLILGRRSAKMFKERASYDNNWKYRAAIIKDLEDPVTELNYLIAFIKICEYRYKERWNDERSKVKFIATAYNYGINNSPEDISGMTDKKFFNTKLFKTDNYCYSDISLFWYNQNIKDER